MPPCGSAQGPALWWNLLADMNRYDESQGWKASSRSSFEPRAALEQCAADAMAGGYTSLSHIFQLNFVFVGLDISIVHEIDKAPARQAVVAGMCQRVHEWHSDHRAGS